MNGKLIVLVIAAASALTAVANVTSAPAATSTIPYLWQNCKHVNARYPHGVGRRFAHDHTSGVPVTNFKRSTLLYNRAMSYNRGLDRDKDGIACEKR
jgi:excalibur calcium-binding domain-containing protein